MNEAVSMVPASVGDEFHSDPSVGVCSVSWLCVYSEIWSRSIVQEMRQAVLIISNSLCSLGAQKGNLLLFCHKFNTTATNSNTTIYILRCRLGGAGAFTASTSGCVRHLRRDAVTQSWLKAPSFCMTFMVALAA